MNSSLPTDVAVDALEMEIAQRRPEGVIHHSDQGSRYTHVSTPTHHGAFGTLNGPLRRIAQQIVHGAGLARPDGRPLHRYPLADKSHLTRLESALGSALPREPQTSDTTAAGFVFWAAETTRAHYPGGGLTWAFLFGRLGWTEDQQLGRRLVGRGLAWWKRPVCTSDAGRRLFLYSLMAEGGLPEAVLRQPGLYKTVFLGLLNEIEAEGGRAAEPWAELIATRWIQRLPQTFRGGDIARLMAELALAFADIRAFLPADLPAAAAERWLDRNRPNWQTEIPLRMEPETLASIIRPALNEDRHASPPTTGSLCCRELVRDGEGQWDCRLVLREEGWIPEGLLPGATDLRLRLLPTASATLTRVVYGAEPGPGGWTVRRLGGREQSIAFPLDRPFTLTAFADGRKRGEAVIDAGIPQPADAPSLWRTATPGNDMSVADRLVPLATGRTRARCVWLLTSAESVPEAEGNLTLTPAGPMAEGPIPAGKLWHATGKGAVRIDSRRYRLTTSAEDDAPEARIFAFGAPMEGWLFRGTMPVHHGEPAFWGQVGAAPLSRITQKELRRSNSRFLGSEVVEWIRDDSLLARRIVFHLPDSLRMELRETGPGRATLRLQGLPSAWRARLSSVHETVEGERQADGSIHAKLWTPGRVPGLIVLRLSEPASGRALELETPWPSSTGMLLNPQGDRLERNQALTVEELQGWRAIVPEAQGDLQFELVKYRPVSLPVRGEASFGSYQPLIESLLAQATENAQVNVSLVVDGQESPRLEIRRYRDQAVLTEDGLLHLGIDRQKPLTAEMTEALEPTEGCQIDLRAVDLVNTDIKEWSETSSPVDLVTALPNAGPWLVQSSLGGRSQHATVWFTGDRPDSTREERMTDYAERWQSLLADAADPEWNRLLKLVRMTRHGYAGSFDQVQALAQAPAVAVALLLRSRGTEAVDVFALDTCVPIFWPAVGASDFTTAVQIELERLRTRLLEYFDEAEAGAEADRALLHSVESALLQRPDLAGHWTQALLEAGVLMRIISSIDQRQDLPGALLLVDPPTRLREAAQEAVKRFDRLPQGVQGLTPQKRPDWLPRFNPFAQTMIDAPLVAAEMAAGLREPPRTGEKIALINLRWVDPLYFERALPAALAYCMQPRA